MVGASSGFRAGSGLSRSEDFERAAAEAAEAAMEGLGADRADWGLLFATAHHRPAYTDILGCVTETLQTECVVGCTGTGVLTQEGEIESGAGVAVLAVAADSVRATPYLFTDSGDGGLSAGYELAATIRDADPARDLLVVLPDPYSVRPEQLLRALDQKLGRIPVIGAAAAEDGSIGATYQFCGEKVASGSVAVLHLSGTFHRALGITQGCLPIGEPLIVTRAHGNVVVELDGRPALTVMIEQIPPALLEDSGRLGQRLFVALPPDPDDRELVSGEYLIRNIVAVDADKGTVSVANPVVVGQPLAFALREGETAREDLKRMIDTVMPEAGQEGRYGAGLYFNCAGRGQALYTHAGIDTAYIGAALGDAPVAGFFGSAEIAPMRGLNRLFTYTGVLAVLGE